MKSYFSRLAKQSRLRYGRANTNSPATAAKKAFGEFAPLHREETILTAPDLPENDAPVKEKNKLLPAEKFSPEKIPQNFDANNRIVHSASEIENEISKDNQSNAQTALVSDALSVVEKIVFTESEITGERDNSDALLNRIDFQSEISGGSEVKAAETTPRQPEYFKKTIENLETGTADKFEVQKNLLQEIYEWVNDAPAPTDDREQTNQPSLKQPGEVRAVVATAPNEEPSLVLRDAAKNAMGNSKPLEEQNYNLSIGTISIIVEEPPPIQNTTIQKTAVETAKMTTREFSRLSRHYL